MKKVLIIIISLVMTTTIYAQNISLEQANKQLEYSKGKLNIPIGYNFETVQKVKVDGVSAMLFRYVKSINSKINEEHFSFLVTENTPFKILGITYMDTKYSNTKQLSRKETENIAKKFLKDIDSELEKNLTNMWIEQHDEEIIIIEEKRIVNGMKYKCYNKSDNNYAWVIVGFDGSIITFERDIIWSNGMQKRVTEKWLHDSWLIEMGQ